MVFTELTINGELPLGFHCGAERQLCSIHWGSTLSHDPRNRGKLTTSTAQRLSRYSRKWCRCRTADEGIRKKELPERQLFFRSFVKATSFCLAISV